MTAAVESLTHRDEPGDNASEAPEPTKREVISTEISRIAARHRGHVTADHVLQASRDARSPLHAEFLWDDDSAAAHLWRRDKAHKLLCLHTRVLEIRREHARRPTKIGRSSVRALVHIRQNDGYRDRSTVLGHKASRKLFVASALNELHSWSQKYADVKELAPVIASIRRALKGFAS